MLPLKMCSLEVKSSKSNNVLQNNGLESPLKHRSPSLKEGPAQKVENFILYGISRALCR